jgi:DNA-binding XRE family transcriptional regulator
MLTQFITSSFKMGHICLILILSMAAACRVKNPLGSQVFATRLRQLRKQKGYSQQKLATEAEIERSTVKRIELMEVTPTLDVLISICRALEIELSELMNDPAITLLDKR